MDDSANPFAVGEQDREAPPPLVWLQRAQWALVIAGALCVLFGLLGAGTGLLFTTIEPDPPATTESDLALIQAFTLVAGTLLFAFGLYCGVVAYGLAARMRWSWFGALVFVVVGLLLFQCLAPAGIVVLIAILDKKSQDALGFHLF